MLGLMGFNKALQEVLDIVRVGRYVETDLDVIFPQFARNDRQFCASGGVYYPQEFIGKSAAELPVTQSRNSMETGAGRHLRR